MALLILDDSNVAVGPGGTDGGFTLKLSDITGLPEGLQILIPFEKQQAAELCDHINQIMSIFPSQKPIVASQADLAREVQHGTTIPTT